MSSPPRHPWTAATSFDGGDLDCGSGLLLLIRRHIDPLAPGQLLEILSREVSVVEDLPAWCRMTGNELVSVQREGREASFLVSKGPFPAKSETGTRFGQGTGPGTGTAEHGTGLATSEVPEEQDPGLATRDGTGTARTPQALRVRESAPITQPIVAVTIPAALPPPSAAPSIPPLAATGIGSWPRPRWLLAALHDHLERRLGDEDFDVTADDAVRLAVAAQERAGVDVVTDGEQRRDGYASFVGGLLDNCQLIPITDLLPYVEDPGAFERELRALDVPAGKIRHPAVFGPLGRSRPLAAHELAFTRTLTAKPVKVALPGPYLLTRTMWMECISDRAYATREALAADVVRVLSEEAHALLAGGAALVQFDEPVLTEVVFGRASSNRTFMCGALGEKLDTAEELAFAEDLLARVTAGLPASRLALHVCRGNWTPDETVALAGDYTPLLPLLSRVAVGTLFLELCTERAGDMDLLAALPADRRIGVGVVNPKSPRVESVDEIVKRAEKAIRLFGAGRVLLNPDCGFATFADNPIAAAAVAEAKMAAVARAAVLLRERHSIANGT